MSFNFTPKTEKQLQEERLFPKGNYPFEVTSAVEKKSKSGNDMIELNLLVYLPDGRQVKFYDWLLPSMAFKLFHFCSYTGLAVKYDQGTLTGQDCVGRQGYCVLGISKDGEKNEIKDYARAPEMKRALTPSKPQPTEAQLANQVGEDTSDVPF